MFTTSFFSPWIPWPRHLRVVVGVLLRLQPRGQGLEALAAHDEELRGEALGVEVQDARLGAEDSGTGPGWRPLK